MINFGIEPARCQQWENKELLDYTIQVEDREFKVHKDVLISISDYFKAMLCGSMKESVMDRVTLPGLSAETVSKTLDLIYTGQQSIVTDSVAEILPCAMYLQMPRVIQVCVDTLLQGLTVQNCLEVLSTFVTYALPEAVEGKRFLMSQWKAVMANYKLEELPVKWLKHIVSNWQQSDLELFLYIKKWIEFDIENRSACIDSLMSHVRFPLMTPVKMEEIKDMDLFKNCPGSWCELVNETVEYHKSPIHQKIANASVQTKMRSDPLPVVFVTTDGNPPDYVDVNALYALEPEHSWGDHKTNLAPTFLNSAPVVIEVNDFLIVCSGLNQDQRWDIFDPRTMTWYPMAKMTTPKTGFAMVHHDGKLYAIGGETDANSNVESLTHSVEEYSFETGTWREVTKLPFAVSKHAACVFDSSVYLSGGFRNDRGKYTCSKDLDLLDLANGTSEKKAPMPKVLDEHQMVVMTLRNKEVIVVIDYNLKIRCYNPKNNQWFGFRPKKVTSTRNLDLQWSDETIKLCKGNVVYFINILTTSKDSGEWCLFKQDCVKWEFSETKTAITEVYLQRFPMRREMDADGVNAFGAIFTLNLK